MRIPNDQRGFTLLEVTLGVAILCVGTYLVTEGVNQMEISSKETRLMSSTERTINNIIDNIRTGLGSYQITYDTSSQVKEDLLKLDKLPMAWGPGVVMSAKDCDNASSCPTGRYGFVITPLTTLRGLYTVTLRMTNTEWKGETFREYNFLVTVQ